jgi:hypothetical protein
MAAVRRVATPEYYNARPQGSKSNVSIFRNNMQKPAYPWEREGQPKSNATSESRQKQRNYFESKWRIEQIPE